MNISKHWLATGVAVVLALGAGYGAAGLLDSHPAPATNAERDEHGHGEESEADHSESEAAEPAAQGIALTVATRAGVALVNVQRGGGGELRLPGRVDVLPGAEANVDAPLPGAVVRLHAAPGQAVSAGSPLVTVRSPDGAASRGTADAAAAAVEVARAAERRDRALYARGWVARARLDVTAAEARRAEAQFRAAQARVRAYGAPGSDGLTVVRSPIAGVVTRLAVTPGSVLRNEALQVATVSNTRNAEFVFDAPPATAARILPGAALEAATPDGRLFPAVVTAIAPADDRGGVLIRARPRSGAPPSGTVVSARVATGEGTTGLFVPVDAVQTVEGAPSVFVVEGDRLRPRAITVGQASGGRVEVLSGLNGTERIAGANAFLLRAELARGEAEHEH